MPLGGPLLSQTGAAATYLPRSDGADGAWVGDDGGDTVRRVEDQTGDGDAAPQAPAEPAGEVATPLPPPPLQLTLAPTPSLSPPPPTTTTATTTHTTLTTTTYTTAHTHSLSYSLSLTHTHHRRANWFANHPMPHTTLCSHVILFFYNTWRRVPHRQTCSLTFVLTTPHPHAHRRTLTHRWCVPTGSLCMQSSKRVFSKRLQKQRAKQARQRTVK